MGNGIKTIIKNKPAPVATLREYCRCAHCQKVKPIKQSHGPVKGNYYCSMSCRNLHVNGRV